MVNTTCVVLCKYELEVKGKCLFLWPSAVSLCRTDYLTAYCVPICMSVPVPIWMKPMCAPVPAGICLPIGLYAGE